MTISYVLACHNDFPFLARTLPYARGVFDQICVLDLGSTDGTSAFCELFLQAGDAYLRRPVNTVPELGFAESRNAAAALATSDWVYFGQANSMPHPGDRMALWITLAQTKEDVLSVGCMHVQPPAGAEGEVNPLLMERELLAQNPQVTEQHRRIIRRSSGIIHKGYIHEEAYLGETNAFSLAVPSNLRFVHFNDWNNRRMRVLRYAWMLSKAAKDPELQKFTNPWWYHTYYPENAGRLAVLASEYERLGVQ